MRDGRSPRGAVLAGEGPIRAPRALVAPRTQRPVALALVVGLTMATMAVLAAPADAQEVPDSLGHEFWLAFPGNLGTPTLSLFITGEESTSGTVRVPGLEFTTDFAVTADEVTTVELPAAAQIESSDVVEAKGIHVSAGAEVTVYGLNRIQATTDAYLGLPTDILGTDHVILGYENVDVVNGTQFAVVGTRDATTVTITPAVTTGQREAGVPYDITLDEGQTYQLRNSNSSPADLSGTLVTSDAPVAVFGGHHCANIPSGQFACDHVVEQLPPTETWGESFVTMPLATRQGGDTFRFLAATDGTEVSVDGTVVATLDRGEFHEQTIDGPAQVTATQPILTAQYSNSSSVDGVTSDPFMMLIPPFEQFLGSYTVTTPASGFATNFINVVAPDAAVGTITLDGEPIPAAAFTPIGASGFSGAQIAVDAGASTLDGPAAFGVFMYGFDSFDSYGYPGGLSLSAVATVTDLALEPATATRQPDEEHCVTATVTDQDGQPVEGVRVDFEVTGTHPRTDFTTTDAAGQAALCYVGTGEGDDQITARVGGLSDTATVTWRLPPVITMTLAPPDATNPVDTTHTVTAGVEADGEALAGADVTFTVTDGPHSGVTGEAITGSEGTAQFTYTGTTVGTDSIVASYVDDFDQLHESEPVSKTWIDVPGAPGQVTATPGDGTATVTWDPPANDGGSPILSYTVTATDGESTVTQSTADTSRTLEGLTNATTYTVTVTATNAAGTGPPSAPVTVTPTAPFSAPGAPTGVTASPGDATAKVSWSPPADDGGQPITSYTVTATDGEATVIQSTADTSLTLEGLTNGTTYTVTVTATNAAGTGPPSDPVTVTPTAAPAPSAPSVPTGVTATPGDGSATVSWSPPADDGGSPVTAYTVTATPASGGNPVVVERGAADREAVVAGLVNDTTYAVTVTATNAVGSGPASTPVSVTPRAPVTAPGAPTGVTAEPGDGTATVAWSPPAADGGSPITSYTVTADGGGTTVSATTQTTSVTLDGLVNDTTHAITVTATNAAGTGPASTPVQVTPTAGAEPTPGPVRNIVAVPGNAGARITWDPPLDDGGSPITGYTVTSSPGGVSTTTSGTATSAVLFGLDSGTSYTFTVTATNAAGASRASSNAVTIEGPEDTGTARATTSSSAIRPGDTFVIEGTGWLPGSTVTIEIFSTPVLLGTANVDGNGRFSQSVRLPDDFPPGDHTLTMTGLDLDSLPRRVSIPMTILERDSGGGETPGGRETPNRGSRGGTVSPTGSDDPSGARGDSRATGTSRSGGSRSGGAATPSSIARTGIGVPGLLLSALVLLGSGGGLVVSTARPRGRHRRRRPKRRAHARPRRCERLFASG